MVSEKDKLLNMLKEGKISEAEFKMLSIALNKKNSTISPLFSMLINPFQKIAGWSSLIAGAIVITCMSYLGVIAKVYFTGILSILNSVVIKNPKIQLNFFLLLYQNMVCWLVMSSLFIMAAKISRKKGIRIVDFFGTVALARFPYLIFTAFISIIQIIDPAFMNIDISKGVQFHMSFTMILFGFVMFFCVIWQVTTYFYALKESSGLTEKHLWISFVTVLVLGEAISSMLTTIFF